MNSCTLDTTVVCTLRQANINHKHRRRRLEPGMLVRHDSFPDKDLQRRKPALTQRNYRHSRFSQSGQVNLHQQATLRIKHRWGLVKVHWSCAMGTGREVLAALKLITEDISELQAVKGLGVVLQHNLTENKDDVNRFSDNF